MEGVAGVERRLGLSRRTRAHRLETDERYEGCLSFFEVRGMLPRPLAIEVDHQDIDGTTRITTFERGMVRLVCHKVDHLFGVLHRSRITPGAWWCRICSSRVST